jgi:hypothetical protein
MATAAVAVTTMALGIPIKPIVPQLTKLWAPTAKPKKSLANGQG